MDHITSAIAYCLRSSAAVQGAIFHDFTVLNATGHTSAVISPSYILGSPKAPLASRRRLMAGSLQDPNFGQKGEALSSTTPRHDKFLAVLASVYSMLALTC